MSAKHGVAFGVFDRFHAGHRDFFEQASTACETLTVVVARDSMVMRFKAHAPWQSEAERVSELRRRGYDARLGDARPGAYELLHQLKPDVIVFGYDQQALQRDVEQRMRAGQLPHARTVVMGSRDPSVHTSTLYPRATPSAPL